MKNCCSVSRCHSMFASKCTPKNRRTTRKKQIKQTFPWSGMSFICAEFKLKKNKFVTRGSPSTLTKLKFKPDIRQLPFVLHHSEFFNKCLVTRILLMGWPQLKNPSASKLRCADRNLIAAAITSKHSQSFAAFETYPMQSQIIPF